MKLTIEKTQNGYLLIDANDKELEHRIYVFEEGQDDFVGEEALRKNEIETFIRLLHVIYDILGPSYSKHEKYNIEIKVRETE